MLFMHHKNWVFSFKKMFTVVIKNSGRIDAYILSFIHELAEGPGVARGTKNLKKKF